LLDDHVSVDEAPFATVVGLASSDTLGAAAATVTVTDCEAEPPLPAQESVKFVVALNGTVVCEPLVPFPPVHPPDAVHAVALLALHCRTEVAPPLIVVGLADSVTVGAALTTDMVTVFAAVPPLPVHDNA
jgi:hypothetical protein